MARRWHKSTHDSARSRPRVRGRRLFGERLEDRRLLSVNVLMYHNDLSGTGVNSNEVALTPVNVNSSSFGKQFTTPVDGQVYAEPLEMTEVNITTGAHQGVHNVIFVATANDSLYAIDAGNGVILWQTSVINNTNPGVLDVNPNANANTVITAVPSADVNSTDIMPIIGIIATPVIDPTTNTIYISAKTKEVISGNTSKPVYVQQLYALNISNGQLQTTIGGTVGAGVLTIAETAVTNPNNPSTSTYTYLSGPSVVDSTGQGAGNVKVNGVNTVVFNALRNLNRPGLTLSNGQIIIGYASDGDQPPYHGWVLGISASTMQLTGVFCEDPNGDDGGIWQSGGRIEVDSAGALYFETGNGLFDSTLNAAGFPSLGDYGDSVVKLVTDSSTAANPNINGWGFHVADYFTPFDQAGLNNDDTDLSSSGLVLLPPSAGDAAHPNLLVASGKNGTLYLIDADTGKMGEFHTSTDNVVEELNTPAGYWSSPTYFNGDFYDTGSGQPTQEYAVANARFVTTPVSTSPDKFSFPGATANVSSDGTVNGIVWELNRGTGDLEAFNASNLADQLYTSAQASGGRDTLGTVVKFSIPMVANGMVYVGTTNSIVGYGLLSPTTAAPGAPSLLAAAAAVSGGVQLQWEPNSTNETAYEIDRSTDGTNFAPIGLAGAGSSSYIDTSGLVPGVKYYYQVRAINPIGDSTFSNIATIQSAATPVTGTWTDSDVGGPAVAGGATFANNTLTLSGSGAGIGNQADQFNFLYQSLTGDGTIIARVLSQSNTSASALAGVMIRDTLDANSAYAFAAISGSAGASFSYRSTAGASASNAGAFAGATAPYWVELVRQGNTIAALASSDGINYTQLGSFVFSSSDMPSTVYVGLAVTAANTTVLDAGTFNDVEVAPPQTLLSSLTPTVPAGPPHGDKRTTTSSIPTYSLNGQYTTFLADLNVNSAVSSGAVDFQVIADGTKIYDSGALAAGTVDHIALNVAGVNQLQLKVVNAGSGSLTAGLAGWPNARLLNALPSTPTALMGQIASGSQINLDWTDTATNVNGYLVLRQSPGSSTFSVVAAVPAQSTSFVDTGLTNGATYSYEVEASNTFGNSVASNLATFSIPVPPTPPINLQRISLTSTSVGLSWQLTSTNQTAVKIYRRDGTTSLFTNIATLAPNATTFTDTGLPPGTLHEYQIQAYNIGGFSDTDDLIITTPNDPPADLTASVGAGEVELSWTPSDGAETYNVYRGTFPGGEGATPYATGLMANSFQDTSISGTNNYYYTVTAVDDGGESAKSTEAAAIFVPDTMPPTSSVAPLASTESSTSFTVNWSGTDGANGSGIASYSVYVSDNGGAFTAFQTNTAQTSATFTGVNGHSYGFYSVATDYMNNVQPTPSAAQANTTVQIPTATTQAVNLASAFNLTGIAADGASFTGGGLDRAGSALSANLLGTSLTAGGVQFTIGAPGGANVVQSRGQTITLPVGSFSTLNLLATAVDGNQASQTFVVHYTDGTSQTFTQSLSDWFSPQNYAGESIALSMAYRDMSNGTADRRSFKIYDYTFKLNGAKIVSSITLPNNMNVVVLAITAVANAGSASVAPPTSLQATSTVPNQVNLSWTAPSGSVTGYNVFRGTTSGGESSTPLNPSPLSAAATGYQDNSAVAGQTYDYVVQAINGSATSANSNEAQVTVASSSAATQAVNLASAFNLTGIAADGATFTGGGLDRAGNALSANLLGTSLTAGGVQFSLDAAGGANVVQSRGQTITLPAGSFSTLNLLATAVDGNQASQTFVVHYTDGTSQTFTQSLSDWFTPQSYPGESVALSMAYRDMSSGTADRRSFKIYDYAFKLNSAKIVSSVTLPNNMNVAILAITATA